jgi:hypothetical protein
MTKPSRAPSNAAPRGESKRAGKTARRPICGGGREKPRQTFVGAPPQSLKIK